MLGDWYIEGKGVGTCVGTSSSWATRCSTVRPEAAPSTRTLPLYAFVCMRVDAHEAAARHAQGSAHRSGPRHAPTPFWPHLHAVQRHSLPLRAHAHAHVAAKAAIRHHLARGPRARRQRGCWRGHGGKAGKRAEMKAARVERLPLGALAAESSLREQLQKACAGHAGVVSARADSHDTDPTS